MRLTCEKTTAFGRRCSFLMCDGQAQPGEDSQLALGDPTHLSRGHESPRSRLRQREDARLHPRRPFPRAARECGHSTGRPQVRHRHARRARRRSEEHTSELQSRPHLVCRLLLEKKKKKTKTPYTQHKKKNKKT